MPGTEVATNTQGYKGWKCHLGRIAYLAHFFSGFTCNQQLQETQFRFYLYRRDLVVKCIIYILRGFFFYLALHLIWNTNQIAFALSLWWKAWCRFASRSCYIPDLGTITQHTLLLVSIHTSNVYFLPLHWCANLRTRHHSKRQEQNDVFKNRQYLVIYLYIVL